MPQNDYHKKLISACGDALARAWGEQWSMIEDDEEVIAAEYLLTVTVARELSNLAPGRIRIERLIRRAFCNGFMRSKKNIKITEDLGQGRIDIVIASDTNHAFPECLVEIKRDMNLKDIAKDASRIARLIIQTNKKLPDLFGICLFPSILYPSASDPDNYDQERQSNIAKINLLVSKLKETFPNVSFGVQCFPNTKYTRPTITPETYEDGTEEVIWDDRGFQMEPLAIVIHQ